MQTRSTVRMIAVALLMLPVSTIIFAQQKTKQSQKPVIEQPRADPAKMLKLPSGPSFYISPVEGNKGMFSILLGDGAGKTVAGTFSLQQLEVFQAVLEAAKAFALSDEKVGSGKPVTTRLMDQHEWSLFVDVSKMGSQSKLYVSLITPQGKLTAEAGEITRGSQKEPSALMLTILSQVQEARSSKPLQ